LPDVTRAFAVKINKYTVWHISEDGRFFAFENDTQRYSEEI